MSSVYDKISLALSTLGKRKEPDSGSQESPLHTKKQAFKPYDQNSLYRRLETFTNITWMGKPPIVGPESCAFRGWINAAHDTLSCEQCEAKLTYPKNSSFEDDEEAEKNTSENFLSLLTSGHSKGCPYRSVCGNKSLLNYVPTLTEPELRQRFLSREGNLLTVDVLPDIDLVCISELRTNEYADAFDTHVFGKPRRTNAVSTPSAIVQELGSDATTLASIGDSSSPAASAFSPKQLQLSSSSGPSSSLTTPGSSAVFIQPSKLTAAQKARLLALLGWDMEIIGFDPSAGAIQPAGSSRSSFMLAHLQVKPTRGSGHTPARSSGGAASSDGGARTEDLAEKPAPWHNASSVVLKCAHCNSRVGLWGFGFQKTAHLGPVGRFRSSGAASIAAASGSPGNCLPLSVGGMMREPVAVSPGGVPGTPRSASYAVAAVAGPAIVQINDPLSSTIAGGNFSAAAAPSPAAAGAATPGPFGLPPVPAFGGPFGAGAAFGASVPVFGLQSLDAKAAILSARKPTGALLSLPAAPPQTPLSRPLFSPVPAATLNAETAVEYRPSGQDKEPETPRSQATKPVHEDANQGSEAPKEADQQPEPAVEGGSAGEAMDTESDAPPSLATASSPTAPATPVQRQLFGASTPVPSSEARGGSFASRLIELIGLSGFKSGQKHPRGVPVVSDASRQAITVSGSGSGFGLDESEPPVKKLKLEAASEEEGPNSDQAAINEETSVADLADTIPPAPQPAAPSLGLLTPAKPSSRLSTLPGGLSSPPCTPAPGIGASAAAQMAAVWTTPAAARVPSGASPSLPAMHALDPHLQHRSWCPWVYTGGEDGEAIRPCGWQHLLMALDAPHRASAAAGAGVENVGTDAPDSGAIPGTFPGPASAGKRPLTPPATGESPTGLGLFESGAAESDQGEHEQRKRTRRSLIDAIRRF